MVAAGLSSSTVALPSTYNLRKLGYQHTPIMAVTQVKPPPLAKPASPVIHGTPAVPVHRRSPYHSSFEVLGGGCDSFLPALKALERPYTPFPVFGWNQHLETIFAALFRSVPNVRFKRECLRMKDDGSVALDWIAGDHRRIPPDSPVAIFLPGMMGGSEDGYVRHMLIKARNNGWRVVVFNSRCCADSPVTTPKFYSGSFVDDIREVVAHVRNRYPKASLYGVGWSLGANILINYLAQDSKNCPLSGAVSLCNPFSLVLADAEFRRGINFIYDRKLASALRKVVRKNALLFEDMDPYNIPLAANAKIVRDFDNGITSPSFGFKSADDYYQKSGSADVVKHVRLPLLCIQAANDPVAPNKAIPREDIKRNPKCMLIVTPKGGHLGWVAGAGAPFGGAWTDQVVMEFLQHLEKREAPVAQMLPATAHGEYGMCSQLFGDGLQPAEPW